MGQKVVLGLARFTIFWKTEMKKRNLVTSPVYIKIPFFPQEGGEEEVKHWLRLLLL